MAHRLVVILLILLLVGCTQAPTTPLNQTTSEPTTQNASPEGTTSQDTQSPASATPIPDAAATPPAGTASLSGQLVTNTPGREPIANAPVFLAQVYQDANTGQEAFALDLANSPASFTDDNGNFSFTGIAPGRYVLSAGDFYGIKDIVREPNGDARVYTLENDKPVDAGVVQVRPDVSRGQ